MSSKLPFKVVFASSSEDGYFADQLEAVSKKPSKGWQSSRFCDYPQFLVIELTALSDIKQVQILSHQSKIASKIELWAGTDRPNTDWEKVSWIRLGYLSLDKNERSNWKARELKSVYIETRANFIKFALHESHLNTINLFNQVGMVGLSILGTPVQTYAKQVKDETATRDLGEYDIQTRKKIEELTIRKTKAVEEENYDEAKKCKIAIDRLKKASSELARLTKEKLVAVEKEDYDTAKALKIQIERLRALSLNPEAVSAMERGPPPSNVQPPTQAPTQAMYYMPNMPNMPNMPFQAYPQAFQNQPMPPYGQQGPPGVVQQSFPQPNPFPGAQAQAVAPAQQTLNVDMNSRGSSNEFKNVSDDQNPNSARNQVHNSAREQVGLDRKIFGAEMPLPAKKAAYEDERPIKPSNPSKHEEIIRSNQSSLGNTGEIVSPLGVGVSPMGAGANAGQAQQEGPEPLKPSVRKDAENLIEMFGEYNVQCLYSKNWNYRDQGLKGIGEFIVKKEHPDQKLVFKLTCKILSKALRDRVAAVYLTSVDLFSTLVSEISCGKSDDNVRADDFVKYTHGLVAELVNTLGHSNHRLIDMSGNMLSSLCQEDPLLARSVYVELVRPMKRKLPKHLKGRGSLLVDLMREFKIPKGITIGQIMVLIKPQLLNKNGDVRDIGVQLATLLFEFVGNKIVPFLQDLNDFLKETLNHSFEQATGQANVLQRVPKSHKEQTRPSKAMNRAAKSNPRSKTRTTNKTHKRKNKAMSPMKQRSPKKAQPTLDETMELDEECNFCGYRDPAFAENEEKLDIHYWQSCPMLTSCKLCEQVIEIPTLHEHILTECEAAKNYSECNKCHVPYPRQKMKSHTPCKPAVAPHEANRCPLCLSDIGPSEEGWRTHLLQYPGCPKNERPLLTS